MERETEENSEWEIVRRAKNVQLEMLRRVTVAIIDFTSQRPACKLANLS